MKFDQEYFRYIVRRQGFRIKEIAVILDLSDRQFNRLIRTESIKLIHIFKIEKMLGLRFSEIFILAEERKI